jgi:hypothetical protein
MVRVISSQTSGMQTIGARAVANMNWSSMWVFWMWLWLAAFRFQFVHGYCSAVCCSSKGLLFRMDRLRIAFVYS